MRKTWLLLALAISVTCLFAKVMADYDHSVNWAHYNTYSWVAINMQEPLWNDRVTAAVDEQLAAQGWSKVVSGGDATIAVVGSTQTERTLETWYTGGFGGGYYHRGWWVAGSPAYSTTIIDRTRVGTLHIDIFDGESKNVIWHGVCTDTLTANPEKNEKKLEKAIADVFKKFPKVVRG